MLRVDSSKRGQLQHLEQHKTLFTEFTKLTRKVSRFVTEEKTAVYGLENAYGYGRRLAVWLIEKGNMVKDVNTSCPMPREKACQCTRKATVIHWAQLLREAGYENETFNYRRVL